MAATSSARTGTGPWDWDNVVIVYGQGGERLAEEVSGLIGLPSSACDTYRTPDGESHVRVGNNVRGRDVFVLQSTSAPVNTNLIELALILSACRRANARRVSAVVPYLGYARQTRKAKSRVPISAADVATLLEECCVDALITIDLHDEQIAGFYSPMCAFDNLSFVSVAARFLARKGFKSSVVVAPTASAVHSAMRLVQALRDIVASDKAAKAAARAVGPGIDAAVGRSLSSASLSSHDQASSVAADESSSAPSPVGLRRQSGGAGPQRATDEHATLAMLLPNERRAAAVKELELTGDVAGRDCILVDDLIDTGNTLVTASRELIARGASCVVAFATHGLFSHHAAERLARCEALSLIVITNTVHTSLPANHPLRRKLAILSVGPMLAHHLCLVSGLPLPDIDALEPLHPLHAGGHTAEAQATPAYLLRKAEEATMFGPGSLRSGSEVDDDRISMTDSLTTASEF